MQKDTVEIGRDAVAAWATRSGSPRTWVGSTELRDLPRELDPFERDWPWQSMGEEQPCPASEPQPVRATPRSPSFERDLERVLVIFSTEN